MLKIFGEITVVTSIEAELKTIFTDFITKKIAKFCLTFQIDKLAVSYLFRLAKLHLKKNYYV